MSSQELEKLLAGLREQTRGVEAPKQVEAALLARIPGGDCPAGAA